MHPSDCFTDLRRVAGPEADELAILCRPEDRSADPARQAEAVYRSLAAQLAGQRAAFRDLVRETLLVADVRRDLPRILDVRAAVLADVGQKACAPRPAFIQQAPVGGASFELAASVVVPRRRDAWSVRDVRPAPSCGCEGCVRSGGRIVRLGDQTSLYTTNLYGTGGDAFDEAWNMFVAAERFLAQWGMSFHDVVRTWIHVRDIDRDYEALNKARRAFFGHCRIERRPASTGVQGGPFPDEHDFSLSFTALKSPRPLDAAVMSTPTLNEAWSYGADFSRGLRVTDRNVVTLHVSGTASIDEEGRTVHVGDFPAQAERMVRNIATLLEGQGAGFENLVSAITYLRDPGDEAALRDVFRKRGFDRFPCSVVIAPLCRPELLCETEAVALLPLVRPGA